MLSLELLKGEALLPYTIKEMPPMQENVTKPKPETEIKLGELQDRYLQSKDVEAYQELFSILYSYARSLILKKTKNKIFLPKDLVDNATLEACVKFMSQYEKPDFRVDASFAGLLNLKILESLYGPKIKQVDQISSLNVHVDTVRTQEKEMEIGDMPEKLKFRYLFRPDASLDSQDPANYVFNKNQDAIEAVIGVLRDIYMKETLKDYMLITLAILHFLRKNKRYEKYRGYYLSPELRNRLDSYLNEVKERLTSMMN